MYDVISNKYIERTITQSAVSKKKNNDKLDVQDSYGGGCSPFHMTNG